jgi:hypothetical protein
MTSTFDINEHYSIELSLNTHENHIYILTVNKTSNKSYENIIRPSDIMNYTFNIESIHKIIVKCFDTDENTDYTFNINCYGDSIKLSFNVLFDEYLKINFDICLTEKKLSSNDELLLNFNKMNIKLIELEKIITEQRNNFEHKITQQEKQIINIEHKNIQQEKQIINLENNLSNCVVNLVNFDSMKHMPANHILQIFRYLVPINLCELDMTKMMLYVDTVDYEKIDYLYKLKKLTLTFNNWGSSNYYNFSTSLAKSKTVEQLTIISSRNSSSNSCRYEIPSTYEFTGLEHFPNLKHLRVTCSYFDTTSFVGNLKSFKHNINKIEMIGCSNLSELENYCRNNKIEILIK